MIWKRPAQQYSLSIIVRSSLTSPSSLATSALSTATPPPNRLPQAISHFLVH